jgi:hypothetical protein
MANNFKHTSRFSILSENTEPINKPPANINSIKKDASDWQTAYNRNDIYSTQNRFNYDPEREKQKAKLAKEESIKKNLDVTISFPDLITPTSNIVITKDPKKPTFLEKIKIVKPTIESINDVQQTKIQPGFVELSYDSKKRKVIYNYGDKLPNINTNIRTELLVLKQLSDNYEKWKEYYIQSWGEEEYNKMYISPNYDYHYFDRLDEEYELQQDELDNQTQNGNKEL